MVFISVKSLYDSIVLKDLKMLKICDEKKRINKMSLTKRKKYILTTLGKIFLRNNKTLKKNISFYTHTHT